MRGCINNGVTKIKEEKKLKKKVRGEIKITRLVTKKINKFGKDTGGGGSVEIMSSQNLLCIANEAVSNSAKGGILFNKFGFSIMGETFF